MRIFTSITSKLRFITELTGLIFNNFNLMTINKEKISQEKLMVQTIDRLNKRSRQKSGWAWVKTARFSRLGVVSDSLLKWSR